MQWSGYYALWGKLSGQADTYCMVNVFLQRHSKRGYGSIWIYPVCCDYVWTGMQIAGWCDEICFHQISPMDEVWIVVFGVFSGKLHDAIMSGQVSLTVENVFVENNIFWECVVDVDGEDDVFGNRLEFVLPRMMYLLDNNNFQTALYFKPFCMMMFLEKVLERSVYFWTGVVLQNTGMCICNICKCMWKWMSLFSFFFSWNLQQTLENNVHVCTYLVQACCTTE